MENFRIIIASLPDREYLVAEILYQGIEWAEIAQEKGELTVQFYSPLDKPYWNFPLKEVLNALESAKNKLLEMSH